MRSRFASLVATVGAANVIASVSGCGPSLLKEKTVEDRVDGEIHLSTKYVSASGTLSTIHGGLAGPPRGGFFVWSSATGDRFELIVCDVSIHCVMIRLLLDTSAAGGVVQLCSCPDDHPFLIVEGSACDVANGDQPSVPSNCQTLQADITVFAHAPRDCQSLHEDDLPACSEKLDAELIVPQIGNAAFSGTLWVRHEIDIVGN